MADFCKECSEYMFDRDFRDLAGLCKEGEYVYAHCERCGNIKVDSEGRKVLKLKKKDSVLKSICVHRGDSINILICDDDVKTNHDSWSKQLKPFSTIITIKDENTIRISGVDLTLSDLLIHVRDRS